MQRHLSATDDLLAAALTGDAGAYRRLLESHSAPVWSLCRRLDPEPEDAYQEVWEKVVRNLERFDPEGPAQLGTWIVTIAHRHLIDRHRARKSRPALSVVADPREPSGRDDVVDRIHHRQRKQALERAMRRLPEDQRGTVLMHHLRGVPLQDIADAEGVAVGTIKSRLHRGRARLCALMKGAP